MYEDLKGKKLLVIGSTAAEVAIIKAAKELGMYTISVDGITNRDVTPAKRAADEAWDMDYSDTEAVAERCRREGVNGVLAGYSEFRVLAACRIAKAIGTPFYATEEQILLTRDKRQFKNACSRCGVKVPQDFCTAYPLSAEERAAIRYPVIVKPADYGGRRGISVCRSEEELDAAVEYAMRMSVGGKLIVEEFLVGTEFSAVYTLADGEISLSCVNEKYTAGDQRTKNQLCELVITPAYMLPRFLKEADGPIKDFLRSIGARNGVANFQGMYTENGVYVFEMGYRINGNNDYKIVAHHNGVNFMHMLINYSVNGTMGPGIEKDDPAFDCYYSTVVMNLHGGTVTKFNYDRLREREEIFDLQFYIREGDRITEDGTTRQKAGMIKESGRTIRDIQEIFNYTYDNLIVRDEKGGNMLFRRLDFAPIAANHERYSGERA